MEPSVVLPALWSHSATPDKKMDLGFSLGIDAKLSFFGIHQERARHDVEKNYEFICKLDNRHAYNVAKPPQTVVREEV